VYARCAPVRAHTSCVESASNPSGSWVTAGPTRDASCERPIDCSWRRHANTAVSDAITIKSTYARSSGPLRPTPAHRRSIPPAQSRGHSALRAKRTRRGLHAAPSPASRITQEGGPIAHPGDRMRPSPARTGDARPPSRTARPTNSCMRPAWIAPSSSGSFETVRSFSRNAARARTSRA
jgi:hypothetical protein